MAAEAGARFQHLLQPIRDLSKVWKIEIAEELEKYIEEVSHLIVANPEDGHTQLNFAEAALLIQGSTAVYSRKVELLYQLVYQALDLLAIGGKDVMGGKKAKAVQTGLWAPIPETDELLTIDHLIKDGRNITLDHSAAEQRQALQRRVPLFLMPRDQADRRKKEFRISGCSVHHSGVYLLQESDARLLDDLITTAGGMQDGQLDEPLVPAPPREVQDLDERLQELLKGLNGDDESQSKEEAKTKEEGKETPTKADAKDTPAKAATPLGKTPDPKAALETKVLPAGPDMWAYLDEHETLGQDLPLEVGKTSKRFNAKHLHMKADGLPEAEAWEPLSDCAVWSGSSAASVTPMLTAGNPVESLFLAAAGNLKPGGRYESQRAAFSAAWLEFEDLFAAAAARRRTNKAFLRSQPADGLDQEGEPLPAPEQGEEGARSDVEDVVEAVTPRRATPARFDVDPTTPGANPRPAPEMSEEKRRHEEQRREVAELETMIQEAQQKYESTIRQHLHKMHAGTGEIDQRKFPQLYANVRKWQDQLEPVLKEFESRPEFDIHNYSTKLLDTISDIRNDKEEDPIPFARLAEGHPRWEVCRRFLTCLILTNHGNTDIVFENESSRLNKFGLKLLKAEKKMISFDDDAQAVRGPSSNSKKQAKKRAAGVDSAADEAASTASAPKHARKSLATNNRAGGAETVSRRIAKSGA